MTNYVIVVKYANSSHKDESLIGEKNWIIYEIVKSKEIGKKLIAVKIDREYTWPTELLSSNTSWAMSFNVEAITKALTSADLNNSCLIHSK
jgi:hypothetical protein